MPVTTGVRARSLQLRRIFVNLGGAVAINLLALVTGPILARALGPTSRGILAAATLWPQLVGAMVGLGLQDAVTYFTSSGQISPRLIRHSTWRLALGQAAGAWLLGAPVVYVVMRHFGSSAVITALLLLAVIPLNSYALNMMYFLNGLHRYKWFNAIQMQVFAVTAIALVVLWVTGQLTVRTAMLATIFSIVVAWAVSLFVARRSSPGKVVRPVPGLERQMLGFGSRSFLSGFPHLLNDRVDQLVMSLVISPHHLGLYVIAATVATAPAFVGAAVSSSVLPTMAALRSVRERVLAARRAILTTFLLTLAGGTVLAAGMRPIMRIVFGRAFLGAVPPARVLCFAAVMISLARVFHGLLKGIGRPIDAAWSEGAALVVTGVGLAALLGPLGIMGAAITSLAAYSTSVAIGAWLTGTALGVRPIRLLWRPLHGLPADD